MLKTILRISPHLRMSKLKRIDDTYTINQTNIDDYLKTMVLKFILGTEELNDQNWAAFKAQIDSFGIQDNHAIQQAA